MEALTLIRQAQVAGLAVEAQGDKMIVRGPKSAELIVRRLAEHKPAILKALRQRRPDQFLASLSLRFAGHPSHHAALDRFCELADEYHDEHGMSVTEAASFAHSGVLFEYSRRACWISEHKGFNRYQVAAAARMHSGGCCSRWLAMAVCVCRPKSCDYAGGISTGSTGGSSYQAPRRSITKAASRAWCRSSRSYSRT